jgi:hypothetical protein
VLTDPGAGGTAQMVVTGANASISDAAVTACAVRDAIVTGCAVSDAVVTACAVRDNLLLGT